MIEPVPTRCHPSLCPMFQRAMSVLARPWNGLLMKSLDDAGTLRFGELRQRLPAVGDRMLALRLRELEARGLVERRVCPGPPVRVEYRLTELGRGFHEVARVLAQWGRGMAAIDGEARSASSEPAARG
jgi:DNA-binding HxlR family transcriptional regulator